MARSQDVHKSDGATQEEALAKNNTRGRLWIRQLRLHLVKPFAESLMATTFLSTLVVLGGALVVFEQLTQHVVDFLDEGRPDMSLMTQQMYPAKVIGLAVGVPNLFPLVALREADVRRPKLNALETKLARS